jgi:anti-anti-sigma factor
MTQYHITERTAGLVVLATMALGSLAVLIAVPLLQLSSTLLIGALVGAIIFSGLLWAYWLGQRWVNVVTVVLTTILTASVIVIDDNTSRHFSPGFFVPPIVIGNMLMGVPGIILSGLLMLGIVIPGIGLDGVNAYADPVRLVMVVIILIGVSMVRLVSDTNARQAEQRAREAEQERARATQATMTAEARAEELVHRNAEQARLLDLLDELEIPAIALADGVLLAPLVGSIDTRRAAKLTQTLLQAVAAQRAQVVILDLAGVSFVDTQVMRELVKTVQAVQLLGCSVILSSISATVAMNISTLGLDMGRFKTARSPQDALEQSIPMPLRN